METGPRLVLLVTHPVTADKLLRGQLAFLRERGFDVTVVSSPGPELERVAAREGVRTMGVAMERPIRPVRDARSLVSVAAALRSLRPHIVNASTPKAGLLGMVAARALGVPVRVYLMRGLRLETARGTLRKVLAATERVAVSCAQDVVCVSPSLRDAAVAGRIVPPGKARVLGSGSSNGVDVDRWARTDARIGQGHRRARQWGITDDAEVVGFVGRLDADKGISDLLEAWAHVRASRPRARLLFIGEGHAGDRDDVLARRVRAAEGVVAIGKSDDLAPLYARMDVLAFPSYREGFPNVPVEAACAEVPAVGFRSTGVVDAIADGETGTIVAQGDVPALAAALLRYLSDPALRAAHGRAGHARAARLFSHRTVWTAWETFYRDRLAAAGV